MKFFTFNPPTPRHSLFRARGASRNLIWEQDWGRSISKSIDSLDVRIMYRDGTKAPLGDFPDIEEGGLVASQSALDVFRNDIDTFFEIVPVNITGEGVIKKSGDWYEVNLKDAPNIPIAVTTIITFIRHDHFNENTPAPQSAHRTNQ